MKKTLAALLAILTIAMTTLASCGGGDTSADTPKDTAAADTTAAETAETTTAAEYVDPGVNYDGAEIVIAAYSSDTYFWQAASYCDAFAAEENGDPINDALYQRNRKVEETLGVKITPYECDVSSRVIDTKLTPLILAGEDLVDAAFVVGSGIPNMIGTGDMLYDLNSIDTLDLSASWWDEKSVEQLTILDSLYCVTGDISLYANFAPIVYFFNKQMVDDFKLDNPYELVRDGSWTADKAIEMSGKVGRDINGDGKRDINDSYGMLCENGSINYMLMGAGVRFSETGSDGLPKITINTEKTVDLIEKFIPYMNDRNSVTTSSHYTGMGFSNVFTEVFIPMFVENRALFYNNQLLVAMNLRDMEADFGILPVPKYDESQDEYITGANGSWISFILVPVTNSQLDMTGHVLDCMGYYGQQYVTPAYIDTTVLNKTLRDDDSAEMLELILDSRTYDIANYYNWGSINTKVSTDLVSGNRTDFASAYAAIEPNITAALQKTIDTIQGK